MISYLRHHQLPEDPECSQRVISQIPLFTLVGGVLCFTGKGSVVPKHLCRQLMDEHHRGRYGSHFFGKKVFKTMSCHWWWQGMHGDVVQFARNCPECTIVSGGGPAVYPPLHPFPVQETISDSCGGYNGPAPHQAW